MSDTPTPAEAHDSAIENMSVDTNTVKPLETPEVPAAAAVTTEAATTETPAPEATATEGDSKPPKVEPWVQKRWDDLAKEKRESDRRAKTAEAELAALKAAKQEPAAATEADKEAAGAAAPPGGYATKAELDAAVAAEVNRREANARNAARQQEFDTKSNSAASAGKTAFGDDFDTAISNLFSVGLLPVRDPSTGQVSNDEILAMVLETESPEKVLFALGSDPGKASELLGMTPAKRAIEIAKLSTAPKKVTPIPVSNAPRPVVPVNGSASSSAEPSDDDDDDTFFRKREAQLAAARG